MSGALVCSMHALCKRYFPAELRKLVNYSDRLPSELDLS